MFDTSYIKKGEKAWKVRQAKLLLNRPDISEDELADAEAEFWDEWYDEDITSIETEN